MYKYLLFSVLFVLFFSGNKIEKNNYFATNNLHTTKSKLEVYYQQKKWAECFRLTEEVNHQDFYSKNIPPKNKNLAYTNFSEIQKQLANTQVLLEYSYTNTSVFLFVISKFKNEVIDLKIHPDSLDKQLKAYRATLWNGNNEVKASHFRMGTKIHDVLLKEANKHLPKTTKHLLIIPQGELSKFPFETLFEKLPKKLETMISNPKSTEIGNVSYNELPYLIKKFEISYYPSATLAFYEETKRKEIFTLDFFGFAPLFKNNQKALSIHKNNIMISLESEKNEAVEDNLAYTTSLRAMSDGVLQHLPNTEEETKTIGQNFSIQNKKVSFFIDKTATEENLKKYLESTKFIHLATHSFFNSFDSDKSGVVAYQPKESEYNENMEDGILYSDEIYKLNMNPELLIMSSCSGGLGKYSAGEGNLSLNRAFMYAGVKNIVFSLWKVQDNATKDLMIIFYKEFLSGKTYSQALQKAKLSALESKYDLPYFWSGFILNWKQ